MVRPYLAHSYLIAEIRSDFSRAFDPGMIHGDLLVLANHLAQWYGDNVSISQRNHCSAYAFLDQFNAGSAQIRRQNPIP